MAGTAAAPRRAFHGEHAKRFAGVSLRPITDHDREFLRALYASTRAAELAPVPWPDEVKAAFLAEQFGFQDAHYRAHFPRADLLLVMYEGAAIGRIYVDRSESDISLIDIALLPAYQRRGIGSALLAELLDEADARPRAISLHVEPNNPAYRLYARLGFALIENRGVYDFLRRAPASR